MKQRAQPLTVVSYGGGVNSTALVIGLSFSEALSDLRSRWPHPLAYTIKCRPPSSA